MFCTSTFRSMIESNSPKANSCGRMAWRCPLVSGVVNYGQIQILVPLFNWLMHK